ncbi:F510_1955 family glycosylhydrolase [Mycolicibacterium fallax]|uniref:F510_1955 family glycosylhydrolase n=1 Tax=Mycolicibacterium fallax TaxID=1793 RepID=UPI0027E27F76|nr:exo-alpha-sialidase [Mycolicibacterium fallax]
MALTPALDHVHGLHLDAQGTVLAGTHTGLVAIDTAGRTARIGESDDDFMGLTGVPGTDHLFASGHPGASSSMPNPLGLIESTDGGRSWAAKSLTGEVDFHALATDGEVLVGFDGRTGLLISTNAGMDWTAGAALAAAALAVTDTGILALTRNGLQRSTDTGHTFTAVVDAPSLALLSAAKSGSLWGVDTDGTTWRSRTGQVWEQRAAVGRVEALLAIDYDTAYAANAQEFYTLD